MAKLNRKQIQEAAIDILRATPGGQRWHAVLAELTAANPETPSNSIRGATHALFKSDQRIEKVARGTYRLSTNDEEISDVESLRSLGEEARVEVEAEPGGVAVSYIESDFYQSFAEWLVEDEVVNAAVALGGSVLRGKWGTPDVLGVLRPRTHDMLKFEPQIVSAEIKIDPAQPVVAFGQAVAYRLFSHKSYIVVPSRTGEDDMGRLKALCTIHGVGLVTFALDKAAPEYTSVVLPVQASPDMFYANQMLRRLLAADAHAFERLLG